MAPCPAETVDEKAFVVKRATQSDFLVVICHPKRPDREYRVVWSDVPLQFDIYRDAERPTAFA
jgi:hypothetical protein